MQCFVFRKLTFEDAKTYLFNIWYFQEIGKMIRIGHPHIVNCKTQTTRTFVSEH